MIDVSPLLLWPADDVLELLPIDSADSPQARRLAILAAEAQAAGQGGAVLGWFCDLARVLFDFTPASSASALAQVLDAAEPLLRPGVAIGQEARELLEALCDSDEPQSSVEAVACALAGSALAVADGVTFSSEQAWQTATELLAALAHVAGDAADPAIGRCAELAYERLFRP